MIDLVGTKTTDLVMVSDDEVFTTTSLLIAEKFGKRHDNILRAIDNLESPDDFNALNFEAVEYTDAKGEKRLMYNITRDGFAFLAMGFTGKEAAEWKIKFLAAFNAMEMKLRKLYSADFKQTQEYKTLVRDVIYGPAGTRLANEQLQLETKLTNKAIQLERAQRKTNETIVELQTKVETLADRVTELEEGGRHNEQEWDKIRKRKVGYMVFDYLH